jgi:WD40 repeat protein
VPEEAEAGAEAAEAEHARDVVEAFGTLQINPSSQETVETASSESVVIHNSLVVSEGKEATDIDTTAEDDSHDDEDDNRYNENDDNDNNPIDSDSLFADFLDPLQGNYDQDGSIVDAFTDEELIAALNSLEPDPHTETGSAFDEYQQQQQQQQQQLDSYLFPLENEELPEIETDLDDDDPLLEPIQDLDQVFEYELSDDEDESPTDFDIAALGTYNDSQDNDDDESDNDTDNDDDFQALALLQQLGNLTLDFQGEDADEHTEDGLPSYLYCQPCSQPNSTTGIASASSLLPPAPAPPPPLSAITEHEPAYYHPYFDKNTGTTFDNSSLSLNHQALQEPPISDRDLDALLQLSVMSLQDDAQLLDDNDELVQGGLPALSYHHTNTETTDHDEHVEAPITTVGDGLVCERTKSHRPQALEAAKQFTDAFEVHVHNADNTSPPPSTTTKMERTCIGHKERIMGMEISECGRYLATASQDSTVRIWDAAKNSLLTTLSEHRSDFECLRVAWACANWADDRVDRSSKSCHKFLLASAGADGSVYLWGCRDPEGEGEDARWTCYATLDHSSFGHFQAMDDNDKPQVYALQFIDHWQGLPSSEVQGNNSFLLTSSDDHVHLWEVDSQKKSKSDDGSSERKVHLREVMSLRFTDMHDSGYGVHIGKVTDSGISVASQQPEDPNNADDATPTEPAKAHKFGGDRNPHNLVYVFDASYCAVNGLLGVALSDGTLRLMNGRGVCLKLLQLPGVQSHLTSFGWDSTGTRLATCVATGHLITWSVAMTTTTTSTGSTSIADATDENADGQAKSVVVGNNNIQTSCVSVMEGGHQAGRPLFGTAYCGANDELLLSWGVDGRVCLWDSRSVDEIQAPLAVLLHKEDYPIYAVNVYQHAQQDNSTRLAVGGGGTQGGFLGLPVYLYNVPGHDPGEPQASKKVKTSTAE